MTTDTYDFDVAVSFAGEDRAYVEDVCGRLKDAGLKVFYDNDYQAEAWGENLVEYFEDVFLRRSRFAVLFISSHYAEKMWPRHERRSALTRAIEQGTAYVLPIRLDDSPIAGLNPAIGYLDARRVGLDGVVETTLAKVGGRASAGPTAVERVPRTAAELQLLLLQRPPSWEYLLFGGELMSALEALEPKYRDYRLGHAPRHGDLLTPAEAARYISRAMDDASYLSHQLEVFMTQEAQERAFGAPGVPGDVDLIQHLARRWTGIYEGFLDWVADLRGVRAPSSWVTALDLFAKYVDDPIETYRRFVARADEVPAAIKEQRPLTIELSLVLRIPDGTTQAAHAELARLKGKS